MQWKFLFEAILENSDFLRLPEPRNSSELPAFCSGLSAVHRALLMAAIENKYNKPIIILSPDETSAESLAEDIRALSGDRPIILTSRDFSFHSIDAVSKELEQKRIEALSKMQKPFRFAIITAAALCQRTINPEILSKKSLIIKSGDEYSPDDIMEKLINLSYTNTELVEAAGQVSRRGGILDFFSPAYKDAIRLEFWGDEIDNMGFFDVSTQRKVEQIDFCQILPSAECTASDIENENQGLAAILEEKARKIGKRRGKEKLVETLKEDAEKLRNDIDLLYIDRYAPEIYGEIKTALDYIPKDAIVFIDQASRFRERGKLYSKDQHEEIEMLLRSGVLQSKAEDYVRSFDKVMKDVENFPLYLLDAFSLSALPTTIRSRHSLVASTLPSYGGSTNQALQDAKAALAAGDRLVIEAGDMRRAKVLAEVLNEAGIKTSLAEFPQSLPECGEVLISGGSLSSGFSFQALKLTVMTDTLIKSSGLKKKKKTNKNKSTMINSYSDLSVGDLVVHEHHGIGRFCGVVKMNVDKVDKDYIKIAYAGTDSLYVPATHLDLVSKYIGGETEKMKLSKMGGVEWQTKKLKAKTSAKAMAKDLIALYASRLNEKGFAFSEDSPWQREFEDSFPYEETDDQLRSLEEIKRDMEDTKPMDRLLCGDVGYGKTELALRACMKCIMDGKQAAILVPTTVLAQQHYNTALRRFMGFPVEIEVLSRFRTKKQMAESLNKIKMGKTDLVIGTHRILQKDLEFRDLGLLVVDEEQRFGVSHKEHIKEMSKLVDVLTLSATPIPRTLNMALSGIRDMSTIEEPPQERLPVQTVVMEHDWGIISEAIRREIKRGGQVFYLHNRIQNIEKVALTIAELVEGARVAVAHGKMGEDRMSRTMEDMVEGEIDVLVCTSIIETGIDIPNANTLIIEDADHLGLSQLHQLRGRVGRSNRRATAYLTFRKDKQLTEIAEKRLEAIREFAEFNSGFRVAMRDLEIRGAGSLLGAEQSGQMMDVGYDMYVKLLEEAVAEEKGEKVRVKASTSADLSVSAHIPEYYVKTTSQRMDLYRRIAMIGDENDADEMLDELIDRYGEPPKETQTLIKIALMRAEAGEQSISEVKQKNNELRFIIDEFNMEKISKMYAMDRYKGKIKVEAGNKPCVSMKLQPKMNVIEEARDFIRAYKSV